MPARPHARALQPAQQQERAAVQPGVALGALRPFRLQKGQRGSAVFQSVQTMLDVHGVTIQIMQ